MIHIIFNLQICMDIYTIPIQPTVIDTVISIEGLFIYIIYTLSVCEMTLFGLC